LYKKYLSNADNLLKNGELKKALEEYEAAKIVFDNAEIIAKIIEVQRLIKYKKQQETKLAQLFSEIQTLIDNNDFPKAKIRIAEILSVDKENTKAKLLLAEVEHLEQKQDKERIEKENKEKCEKITAESDKLFQSEKWVEAEAQYQIALNLCPQNKDLQNKIKQCNTKIKEQEDAFKSLLADAIFAKKEGKLKEALSFLERALKMQPDNADVKSRIDKINFDLQFEKGSSPKMQPNSKREDNFFGNSQTTETPKSSNNNDFLGVKPNKQTPIKNKKDDFIIKNQKKSFDEEDDFLKLKKKN
jgi:hypothetical protein